MNKQKMSYNELAEREEGLIELGSFIRKQAQGILSSGLSSELLTAEDRTTLGDHCAELIVLGTELYQRGRPS